MTLREPAGVAADIEGGLAISDTGGHRVLVGHSVGPAFDVRHVVGSGEPGFRDGTLEEAAFREPRGLAISGDLLLVADTGNHAVRMVDLAAGRVGTMAGTGEPAAGAIEGGGNPLATALASPWDVRLHEYDLFVAMAGTREVWRLDLKEGAIVRHQGAESDGDGAGGRGSGAVALAADDDRLFVVDAASATVRVLPFEEGEARVAESSGALSGPAGVTWGQGNHRLWIADTGNDRLMLLDAASGALEAVDPFEADLSRPTALASAGHLVYVADTGNDRVLRVDQVDKRVVELEVGETAAR